MAAWGWVGLLCRRFDKYIGFQVPGWLTIPGLALLVAGLVLAAITIGFFVFEGRGTPAVFDPPRRFVPHGPFRFIRNPMYVGWVTILLGLALYLASASMVLYAMAVFFLIHTFVVRVEEPGLRKRFGEEYAEYCRRVPRWLPRLSRGHSGT